MYEQTLTLEARRPATAGPVNQKSAMRDQVLTRATELCAVEEFEAAMQLLAGLVASEPEDAEAWHQLGVVAGSVGSPADALRCMWKSIELDRHNSGYLNNLGYLYQTLDEPDAAARRYIDAIREDESNADPVRNLLGVLDPEAHMEAVQLCIHHLRSLEPEDEVIRAAAAEIDWPENYQGAAYGHLADQLSAVVCS